MSYLYILGRQPEFGLAELESAAGQAEAYGSCAISDLKLDIAKLGGTVKVARVITRRGFDGLDHLTIPTSLLPQFQGKFNYGVSFYGLPASRGRLHAFGLNLKKQLKSARFVAPAGHELNSAQLKYNQIPAKGFELIIAVYNRQVVLAITEQYQDIDWYAERDYGRPARSAKVGMLPPKLAQILVNTTHADLVIDPFCGTGVVLQEALLLGRQAMGSDLEADMVKACQANLEWLAKQVKTPLPPWSVHVADARKVKIPTGAAIVTEGYLGRNLNPGQQPTAAEIKDLAQLYADCLSSWAKQLPAGTEITICLPAWQHHTLPLVDHLTDLGYTLKVFKHVNSKDFIYKRPDQMVGRQVLAMVKI